MLEIMVNHLSSCSLFKGGQYGNVISMVEEVNKHHHTKTCRKKFTECRFQFKKFPSRRTIIARPPKGESEDISLKIQKKHEVHARVKKVIMTTAK